MPLPIHPDLEIIKFEIYIEDQDPLVVQVEGSDKIEFKIPESSKYYMTVYFKVKNRTLKDLKYKQVVKKHGFTIRQRDLEIGPVYEPSEDTIYSQKFPEDVTPGGFLIRGAYPATSTYYTGDEELMTVQWSLEITKKN